MCLAVPMEIHSIDEQVAEVEVGGVRQKVRLDLLVEPAEVGQFVMVHAGYALRAIDREEAIETLKLFQDRLNLDLL